MNFESMTVTAGTLPQGQDQVTLPYTFCAYSGEQDLEQNRHVVQIVMPLGGVESGLFRYPNPGEKVLVGIESTYTAQREKITLEGGEPFHVVTGITPNPSKYYLMGYVPSAANQPFSPKPAGSTEEDVIDSTKTDVIDNQGQVFRYQKTGTNTSDAEYSEIGFYRKETQWISNPIIISADEALALKLTTLGLKGYPIRRSGTASPYTYQGGKDENIYITDPNDRKMIDNWVQTNTWIIISADEASALKLTTPGLEGYPIKRSGTASPYTYKGGQDGKIYITDPNDRSMIDNWITQHSIDGKYYPKIDRINIQSTGDIESRAANHNLIRGKRLEIISGGNGTNHQNNKAVQPDGKETVGLPLGDKLGDDSKLHDGDIHIRAFDSKQGSGRVIIKAGKEIRLQVGRTVLSITDTGFSVVTKKVAGNWPCSADTALSMNPRTGITMFGQNVAISGGYKVSLTDALSGGISAQLGATRVCGRDVTLDSYNCTEYKFATALETLDIASNATFLGSAQNGDDPSQNAAQIKDYFDLGKQLIQCGKKVLPLYQKISKRNKDAADYDTAYETDAAAKYIHAYGAGDESQPLIDAARPPQNGATAEVVKKAADAADAKKAADAAAEAWGIVKDGDWVKVFLQTVDMTFDLINGVFTVLDQFFKSSGSETRDKLYMAAYFIEIGITDIANIPFGLEASPVAASIKLGTNGNIKLKSNEQVDVGTQATQAQTPTVVATGLTYTAKIVSLTPPLAKIGADIMNIVTTNSKKGQSAPEYL